MKPWEDCPGTITPFCKIINQFVKISFSFEGAER